MKVILLNNNPAVSKLVSVSLNKLEFTNFESEETKKQYVVYTDNSKDKDGNVRVFASIYKLNDKGGELLPIKTDKEWKVIETILETIQQESKKTEE